MPEVRFSGYFPWDYTGPERFIEPRGVKPDPMPVFPPVEIRDARALQEDRDPAGFLAERGFALVRHATRVRDWDAEVADVYLPEVEALIRERLFPGRRVIVHQRQNLIRRGRGTEVDYYSQEIHADGGLDLDDYVHNMDAFSFDPGLAGRWRARYERDDVEGLVWLDFWRTTNMTGPLAHMPLALCDPASVDPADLVRIEVTGIAPEGRPTHHAALRFNPHQRWYYYPEMRPDEVLVFKLGGFDKVPGPLQVCFHAAFADPAAPADAEPRQSCEHRVGVLLLRD